MTPAELARRHPLLFHTTEPGALESIRAHGLVPASGLLERLGIGAERLVELTEAPRRVAVGLDGAPFGRVVLQDNRPLQPAVLERYLRDGLGVADWCRMLNERVFFWADRKGLARLLGAQRNRGRERLVLAFDTAGLIAVHSDRVELSAINSGAAWRRASPRGLGTFVQLAEWGPGRARILEVVVRGEVADAWRHVRSVERVPAQRLDAEPGARLASP